MPKLDNKLPTTKDELEPIDPKCRPTKTLEQIAAEHPEWIGLNKLVVDQAMAQLEFAKKKGAVH